MGTLKRIGPLALTNVYTTNVYNQGSALLYDEIQHIHVVNNTGAAKTFRLFIGATGANAAGTDVFYDHEVPAGGEFNEYVRWKLMSTEFLVGGASAAGLTITLQSEQHVV